ncbi:hypothetical protein JOE11_003219 [Robbsia andropogonis]
MSLTRLYTDRDAQGKLIAAYIALAEPEREKARNA